MITIKKYISIIYLIYIIFCTIACDLPHMPGPQPKDILGVNFEPGLNILGILRLNEDNPESFVYIEELVKTKIFNDTGFVSIKNASVLIKGTLDPTQYGFIIDESIDSIRYKNDTFIPIEGETYHLSIEANTDNGALSLTAEATVPIKPSIVENSMDIQNNSIRFDLITTDDTYQYDIHLFFEDDENELKQAFHINENGVMTVEFNFPNSFGTPEVIGIAGYDQNLNTYMKASSSVIPQTYQETLSTVEGGYGCFGALSLKIVELE